MPVRDFATDTTGDRVVVNGDWALAGALPTMTTAEAKAADLAAVAQSIRIRVQMFLGEYWLDEAIGVDWVGQILVKDPNQVAVRALISRAIADAPDVVSVEGADLQNDGGREYSIAYKVRTVYGIVEGVALSPLA